MIHYVGFCGKAGAGKTTACNILKELHQKQPPPPACLILPWADELKRIAREEFGWDGKKDEKGRRLLQVIGTECGRMYGGDLFWVNKWQQKVDEFITAGMIAVGVNVLILNDDTRFDSEAIHIKERGGTLIKLFGRQDDLGANSNHSSETGIDHQYIDYSLDNGNSMEDLQEKLTHFYGELKWD